MSTLIVDNHTFIEAWNALERPERKRLRRLVRLGRPIDEPKLAPLAASYAQFQQDRIWVRFFWAWFVPGVVIALAIASQIHPVLVGVVLACAAQAALTKYNLRRVARTSSA